MFKHVPICYVNKAILLIELLKKHVSYKKLGGVKIKRRPELVRFKVGRNYRFIFKMKNGLLTPYSLITRQDFDREIKRRCS